MSYDTVKNKLRDILESLGLAESENMFDFENAPANEYGQTFILECISGEMDETNSETIIDRFYDKQIWQAQIAIPYGAQDDRTQYDQAHRLKDQIIAAVDKPANWSGGAKIVKYASWEMRKFPNYYNIVVTMAITDEYQYS